ncbi:guanylate kinase [Neoehrlichia mikurensis]|uniref:guanylate kinase n=1 Tax=Neoehrlichia mikurensis TaxID=89586 RepID=UPI002100ED85|nr:guanylate kinase [Neoehrlichia mikurensis]
MQDNIVALELRTEGVMLVISSPSGGGKTTISNLLVNDKSNNTVRSISMTTRAPRNGEVHGRDYFFVSVSEFLELCNSGMMLEYAKVFGNYYGIPSDFVKNHINNGVNVLFTIDWQGAFKLIELMNQYVVSIFILPPSMQELQRRLYNRSGNNIEIENRLGEASFEISHCYKYDYIIVNNNIIDSVNQIQCILKAEKLKTRRQIKLKEFITQSLNIKR